MWEYLVKVVSHVPNSSWKTQLASWLWCSANPGRGPQVIETQKQCVQTSYILNMSPWNLSIITCYGCKNYILQAASPGSSPLGLKQKCFQSFCITIMTRHQNCGGLLNLYCESSFRTSKLFVSNVLQGRTILDTVASSTKRTLKKYSRELILHVNILETLR